MTTGRALSVVLQAPDPIAFEPFGAFLAPPTEVGGRAMFNKWLEDVPGASPQYHINRVAPSTLPLTLAQVEQHPHASQVFLPLGVSRYLVTVMPSDDVGAPDWEKAVSFLVPGTLAVAYHPKTWHTGIAVLDAEGSFAVMMWRGREDDDVFAAISPLEIQLDG